MQYYLNLITLNRPLSLPGKKIPDRNWLFNFYHQSIIEKVSHFLEIKRLRNTLQNSANALLTYFMRILAA